ncbi:MAG: hypothetical protein MJ014_08290, partial [Methanocorpusculum sp.]|nr:hypothetical protein [Methanocorpusculum sp.]
MEQYRTGHLACSPPESPRDEMIPSAAEIIGVLAMSRTIPVLVQTSTNLSSIKNAGPFPDHHNLPVECDGGRETRGIKDGCRGVPEM